VHTHEWLLNDGRAPGFALCEAGNSAPVHYAEADHPVVARAVRDFADDLARVGGCSCDPAAGDFRPGSCPILIGTLDVSPLIGKIVAHAPRPEFTALRGQWEGFLIAHVEHPLPDVPEALLVVGSDPRGTAFGVYQLARAIGVSPWHWWADVDPERRETVKLPRGFSFRDAPRIRYRGIFINDEVFGMNLWARENFEPEHPKQLGPKTYRRIYELMLRLKANTLCPALCGNCFSAIPENRALAQEYAIIIGSQHSEPLSSYGTEWDRATMGDWNYATNREGILRFLESRVAANKSGEILYTLGLRGINDQPMEGNPTRIEEAAILGRIIGEQRDILARQIARPLTGIPQVLFLYKEVLKNFDYGFPLPDDVTLVWTDDNFGYIKRLPEPAIRVRSGGHGLYYHTGYIGRPTDHGFVCGTVPALILHELRKAWDFGVRRYWVFNVGDIKPNYYNIQLCLDLAWNPEGITPENRAAHQDAFFAENLGAAMAGEASRLWDAYNQLTFARRAEHMAWSRIEQHRDACEAEMIWTHQHEAETRLAEFGRLAADSQRLLGHVASARHDAVFQMLHFSIASSDCLNRKWLHLARSEWFRRQGRSTAANAYAAAWSAFREAWEIIDAANALRNGKWAPWHGMYPFPEFTEPRYLEPGEKPRWIRPDPFEPIVNFPTPPATVSPAVWVEGDDGIVGIGVNPLRTPVLCPHGRRNTFLEIYNRGTQPFAVAATTDATWLVVEPSCAQWQAGSDVRISLSLRAEALPVGSSEAMVTIRAAEQLFQVSVPAFHPGAIPDAGCSPAWIEDAGAITIPATGYCARHAPEGIVWRTVHGLGLFGEMMEGGPAIAERFADDWGVKSKNPWLDYRFFTFNRGWVTIESAVLALHASSKERGCIHALSLNDGPELIVNAATYQRDEAWMQAVESNLVRVRTRHFIRTPGWQTLRLHLCDTGVHFDHFAIDFGHRPPTWIPPPPRAYPHA
jgi:hypothetical protein